MWLTDHLNIFFSEKEEENDEVEDMEVENSMECKLSLNSYKIRFVKGSEDYLYRRQALKRAKEVSTCRDFEGAQPRPPAFLRDGRKLEVGFSLVFVKNVKLQVPNCELFNLLVRGENALKART